MPGWIDQLRPFVRPGLGLRGRWRDRPPRASDIILGMTLAVLGIVLLAKGAQLLADALAASLATT